MTRWPLWGKNAAPLVGFFLEFLFQPQTHPLASFSFHRQFNLS
jgi:hypothetical protein